MTNAQYREPSSQNRRGMREPYPKLEPRKGQVFFCSFAFRGFLAILLSRNSKRCHEKRAQMILYLIRHGRAVNEHTDIRRPLDEQGRREAEQVGLFLKRERVEPSVIWHTERLRSVQTAEIIARHLAGVDRLKIQKGLGPDDPVIKIGEQIMEYALRKPDAVLLIVGHLPSLEKLALFLAGGCQKLKDFYYTTGSLVELESQESAPWKLRQCLTPDEAAHR